MANHGRSDSAGRGIHILALSGDDRPELTTELGRLYSKFDTDADGNGLTEYARQSIQGFDPGMAERLVMVWEHTQNPAAKISATLQALKAETVDKEQLPADVFYGGPSPPGRLAFLFPGQGSQYLHMGRQLLLNLPDGRAVLDATAPLFHRNRRLHSFVFPDADAEGGDKKILENRLRQTDVAQPAIGVVSRVMHRILARFNVFPDAAGGHSFGELPALCAGGFFGESDMLFLSVWRGQLMAAAGDGKDRGMMLAVMAPLDKIEDLVRQSGLEVVLANRNSPDQGVLSGPSEAIAQIKSLCKQNRMRAIQLPVSAAFHSRLVEDAAVPFREKIKEIAFRAGEVRVYSNTTALPYPHDPEAARALLDEHLLQPVHFVDEIRNMYDAGVRTFLEVGPKAVLTGLVQSILSDRPHAAFSVDASAGRRGSVMDLAATVARLAAMGYPVSLGQWERLG
ncbi:MAG: acyltransferase domain-containing protein [Thermodesulfobacteriota bacterium]